MRNRLLALLLVGACGASDPVVSPGGTDGKSDVNLDAITIVDPLGFGASAAGEFTEDFQFFGYRVLAAPGAVIDVEVPCAGSAADLDTTLFVYGPNVTSGSTALATDNNSGCGKHARISNLALPEQGEYLIVVGTASGA